MLTRKSSRMNARAIPPEVHQISHPLSYTGGGCTPSKAGGTPSLDREVPIPGWGTPSWPGWGTSSPLLDLTGVPPPRRDQGPVTWVPPGVDRHTPLKTVPSRRTTYAGANNNDVMSLETLSLPYEVQSEASLLYFKGTFVLLFLSSWLFSNWFSLSFPQKTPKFTMLCVTQLLERKSQCHIQLENDTDSHHLTGRNHKLKR